MRIDTLRQWHWILISLVAGFAIGYLREQSAADLAASFGSEINGQARFEQSLVTLEQGRPCFTDVRVLTHKLPDRTGALKDVCIVSGQYFDGHYEPDGGKLIGQWKPAFFVAPIPYKPATDVLRRGDGKPAERFANLANPKVTDFLDALSSSGVRYSRAWWQGLRMWQWVVLSVAVIGVAWPVTINLLVFGSWRRPREEKGTDLSKVKLPPAEAKKAIVTDEEIAQLAATIDGLESELSEGATVATQTQPADIAPVPELATTPVMVEQQSDRDDVTYGAKPDDFYPTAKVTPGHVK
jgi:hypothetical protein